ncbi:coilin isoform X2 [Cryptomeria japonica]|uniref:coilin isoform X2 n=1 Tax=Cryptomeria japonica TaxID=3369 RepID=UPI0027DA506C|nr:coilin isoform X2 [Cryptomeria japonica]
MEGTGEVVRIRLIFEDEYILNRRQRSEGLKQCWMIVKPYLKAVEQIASDILYTFNLHRTCPCGLLLSMEGYTLPSTQPTCILKDKDIVVVNKKRETLEKKIINSEEASLKDSETLGERLPGHGGVKLLAIDEFEEEAGGYQSEYEDNGTNSKDDADVIQMEKLSIRKEISRKKRKQSELVQHSKVKNKRKKINHSEEIPCNAVKCQSHTKALEVEVEDTEVVSGLQLKEKKSRKKPKEKKTECVKVNKESNEFPQVDHMAERCLEREDDQVEGIVTATENASMPTEGGKKLVQSNGFVDQKLHPKSDKPRKSNQDNDIEAEEESLPVVVRPGHIRFLPLDEEYEAQEIEDLTPVLQWNGITTKRQGQNWGKEKNNNVNREKKPVCFREEDNISSDDMKEETLNKCPLDFDKLPSMSGLPQQGDVIAYRLVELSIASWCPELSSFRVGKIASYDSCSTKIRLVPVSEYPFVVKNSVSEEYAEETDISLYNEDGSLEIDFGSLVDVRWINQQNCSSNMNTGMPDVKVAGKVATCTNGERNSNSSTDMNTGFRVTEESITATNANGDGEYMSVWDEINQAFSSKKAELALKEDLLEPVNMDTKPAKASKKSRSKTMKEKPCISKQGNGTPTSRTFKSLRGSAIGPTISLLRAQNVLK